MRRPASFELPQRVEPHAAERPLALGLDLGTSAARAAVFDRVGRSLGGSRLSYRWSTTADGGVEADAEAVASCCADAIDGALARAGAAASEVAAVGLCSFWHGLVGVDADGRAVTPLYAWNDVRATAAAAELRRRLDGEAVRSRTGAPLHPSFLPARLLWLSGARPELVRRVRWWLAPGDYLALRLFGEPRSALSLASGTGLLDQRRWEWDAPLLEAVGGDAGRFPPFVDLDSPFAGLRPEFARRWPALRDLPWTPALGDGAAANVGSGCTGAAAAALSLGSSGALRVLAPNVAVDETPPGLWCYRLDRGRAVVGGAISNGGIVHERLRSLLRLPGAASLERELAAMPPDAHGLTVLPFLAGERSPDWPLDARSAIVGLSLDTSPAHVLRAAMEAVAYRLALVDRRLRARFPETEILIGSGGALWRSGVWAGIVADVLGRPLRLSTVREASSRGAALVALEAAGFADAESAPRPWGRLVEPDVVRHERYLAGLERHRALDARMAGTKGEANGTAG